MRLIVADWQPVAFCPQQMLLASWREVLWSHSCCMSIVGALRVIEALLNNWASCYSVARFLQHFMALQLACHVLLVPARLLSLCYEYELVLPFRSCAQHAAEPEDATTRAEWQCLAAQLAQIITAHQPSISDHSNAEHVKGMVTQLLQAASAPRSHDR